MDNFHQTSNEPSRNGHDQHHLGFVMKFSAISLFMLIDLGINSIADMDDYPLLFAHASTSNVTSSTNKFEGSTFNTTTSTTKTPEHLNRSKRIENIHVLIFGSQVLVQICILGTVFLLLCDTFHFQVGLVGIFFKKDKKGENSKVTKRNCQGQQPSVLLMPFLQLYIFYLMLTCIVGSYRLSLISSTLSESTNYRIETGPFFIALSCLHKLASPWYYAKILKVALELGMPIYLSPPRWY